jgi:hypothetical protein
MAFLNCDFSRNFESTLNSSFDRAVRASPGGLVIGLEVEKKKNI